MQTVSRNTIVIIDREDNNLYDILSKKKYVKDKSNEKNIVYGNEKYHIGSIYVV